MNYPTRRRFLQSTGAGGAAMVAGCTEAFEPRTETQKKMNEKKQSTDRIAADPTDIPEPISRDSPETVDVTLRVEEVEAEIEEGVKFNYMTYNGQVPGPFIRVRQGDTVRVKLENLEQNKLPHNVDFHAVAGPGGGAEATMTAPGETAYLEFKATYPGAYIYHCAVPNMDMHISAGMFGLILVEPKDGLPEVDHEFYLGQHEIYTDKETGEEGKHKFDFTTMKSEDPTYVLMNGEKYALTSSKYGPMNVEIGDTARVFFVVGGPNLGSSFHPIGNVWERLYPEGSLSNEPQKHIQTRFVPSGSNAISELDFDVPGNYNIVDHSLSRVARKGCLAVISAEGEENHEVFNPEPDEEW